MEERVVPEAPTAKTERPQEKPKPPKVEEKGEEAEEKARKPKTQRVVQFDEQSSKISFKLDMASVYSQKSKDAEDELKAALRAEKTAGKTAEELYMARRKGPEPKDMVEPSKSWRNPSRTRGESERRGHENYQAASARLGTTKKDIVSNRKTSKQKSGSPGG